MSGGARQKSTDDYKDFLISGKSSTELTEADKENIIFATGARGIENKEALVKSDWKPVKAGSRIDGEFTLRGEVGRFCDSCVPQPAISPSLIILHSPQSLHSFSSFPVLNLEPSPEHAHHPSGAQLDGCRAVRGSIHR